MGSLDGEGGGLFNALGDDADPRGLARLEERLAVRFTDPRLLRQAFVHSSVLNERPDYYLASNERLEFLGDAFLSFVVADYLHTRCPDLSEGELTLRRAAIVCTDSLAGLASDLGLGEFLAVSRGEDQRGGRQRRRVLAGTLEALIGAVFLDQGYALARTFVLRLVDSVLERLSLEGIIPDHKSQLQMRVQSERHVAPVYRTAAETGPAHAREFVVEVLVEGEVWGSGHGSSKRVAEQEAARQALDGRGLFADEPEGAP
ncbi:MAG: ribonuclease III [Chloroflexi bacterium]|nr:ribonuclease III [Chloroflexota bacterium]